ncbi:hypothetical protein CN03_02970 [Thalassolituus oleivorans]|jgi:hypothetical protein|uniref:methyltransferase n=1 Tax=Thalassolituus oleivorans TaxID=187493 RepID=UPI0009494C57|nr:methyltransferase [Thalassolituus oleivorans]APR65977.1 hypothetical protein CN03_02970 [Thalassolituus oleivorans]
MSLLEKPLISECGRFHLSTLGIPIYEPRFDEVLAYHEVGGRWIAPAQVGCESFHIDLSGKPIYDDRFLRCFGFYDGLAAVMDHDGWYHIDQTGCALYKERYAFVGNYQQKVSVVTDMKSQYFHINEHGKPIYDSRWQYCGDFRDGIAVVQSIKGLSTHIRNNGSLLHGKWFLDLDVYHKGFARAKSSGGWCHINGQGEATYKCRFASVEPFYNGFARCETFDGCLVIIDESGKTVRQLRASFTDKFSELSADMVGYWKTYTIYTAVKLKVFEHLPNSLENLAISCSSESLRLARLMRGLSELELVYMEGDSYFVTEKGGYLCSGHEKTLCDAAIEYGEDLLKRWEYLPKLIQGQPAISDIFSSVANNPQRLVSHHRMLASYALHDYSSITPLLPIEKGNLVLDAGGGTGTLANMMQVQFPDSIFHLGDFKEVITKSNFSNKLVLDLFSDWRGFYDIVVLARVLHDWSDLDAVKILENAKRVLGGKGRIMILEMLMSEESCFGALCDLHLLAASGGRERTAAEFDILAKKAGLQIKQITELPSLVSLIVLEAV